MVAGFAIQVCQQRSMEMQRNDKSTDKLSRKTQATNGVKMKSIYAGGKKREGFEHGESFLDGTGGVGKWDVKKKENG